MKKYEIEIKKEYYLNDPRIASVVTDKINTISYLIDPHLIINHYLRSEIYILGNYRKCFDDRYYNSRLFYFRLLMRCRRINTCDTFVIYNEYYLRKDLEYHLTVANMMDLLLIYSLDEIFYDMVNYVCALYCPLSPNLAREVHYNYKNKKQRRIL